MTVNERLVAAGLLHDYDCAKASGDLNKINAVLAKVELHQNENDMNWPIDAPNA